MRNYKHTGHAKIKKQRARKQKEAETLHALLTTPSAPAKTTRKFSTNLSRFLARFKKINTEFLSVSTDIQTYLSHTIANIDQKANTDPEIIRAELWNKMLRLQKLAAKISKETTAKLPEDLQKNLKKLAEGIENQQDILLSMARELEPFITPQPTQSLTIKI